MGLANVWVPTCATIHVSTHSFRFVETSIHGSVEEKYHLCWQIESWYMLLQRCSHQSFGYSTMPWVHPWLGMVSKDHLAVYIQWWLGDEWDDRTPLYHHPWLVNPHISSPGSAKSPSLQPPRPPPPARQPSPQRQLLGQKHGRGGVFRPLQVNHLYQVKCQIFVVGYPSVNKNIEDLTCQIPFHHVSPWLWAINSSGDFNQHALRQFAAGKLI